MLNESFTERSRWPLHEEEGEAAESGPELLAPGWYHQEDGRAATPHEGEGWIPASNIGDGSSGDESTFDPESDATLNRTILYVPNGAESFTAVAARVFFDGQCTMDGALYWDGSAIQISDWDSDMQGPTLLGGEWKNFSSTGSSVPAPIYFHFTGNTVPPGVQVGDARLT